MPKHLKNAQASGRLKPIFRDREDLAAAGDLGAKIEQALAASECLIVICSPHAAKSHWVNKEILSFKRANRDAKIFSIIVEGKPFASSDEGGVDGGDDTECMPPALRFEMGEDGALTGKPAEPLAADLRKSGDGKRYGVLKIISAMLGVGLDELVQRDLQRNRSRVTTVTAGALATVLAMGALTGFAMSARKEAEQQSRAAHTARTEADNRRDAAEGMIEFMITELKPELESAGRLKPLSIIGARAAQYYEEQPLTAHNDNALGRRARVFHMIGEIEDKYGDLAKAQKRFDAAYASTKALFARNPNNPDRIFDHAQSAYWAGYLPYREGDYAGAENYFQEYIKLAERLKVVEPDSLRSLQEITYAYTNLGIAKFQQKQFVEAEKIFAKVLPTYIQLSKKNPQKIRRFFDLGDELGWLADTNYELGFFDSATNYRNRQREIYAHLLRDYPNDHVIKHYDRNAIIGLIKIHIKTKNFPQAFLDINIASEYSAELESVDTDNSLWLVDAEFIKLLKAETLISSEKYSESKKLLNEVEISELRLSSKLSTSELKYIKDQRLLIFRALKKHESISRFKRMQND